MRAKNQIAHMMVNFTETWMPESSARKKTVKHCQADSKTKLNEELSR